MYLFYLNIDKFNSLENFFQGFSLVYNLSSTEKYNPKSLKYKQHILSGYIINYASKNFYSIKNPKIEIINKKPSFKYSNIQFSISHSNNLAIVCFDEYPVGIDIEFIKNRNYKAVSKRMNFKTADNTLEEFYINWTKYEAEYKLHEKLQDTISFKFYDNYIISIASSTKQDIKHKLKIFEILPDNKHKEYYSPHIECFSHLYNL